MHHIVDPRTGTPVASYWRTVSVAAASCVEANAAAAAAIVKGEGAFDWHERAALPARLVRSDGWVARTSAWPKETP
jgi:FAD:protein FMN transferase